eukprot:643772-Rhodomonas_salina.1
MRTAQRQLLVAVLALLRVTAAAGWRPIASVRLPARPLVRSLRLRGGLEDSSLGGAESMRDAPELSEAERIDQEWEKEELDGGSLQHLSLVPPPTHHLAQRQLTWGCVVGTAGGVNGGRQAPPQRSGR